MIKLDGSVEPRKIAFTVCCDPRLGCFPGITLGPNDLIVPVPGGYFGGSDHLPERLSFIPRIEEFMWCFTTHNPCGAIPNGDVARRLGCTYANSFTRAGLMSASVFLGMASVNLYSPRNDSAKSSQFQRVFEEASHSQRRGYDFDEGFKIEEVAIAPYFTAKDLSRRVLHISSEYLWLPGIKVIKRVLGGFIPHRNYDPKLPSGRIDCFEAAFAAA